MELCSWMSGLSGINLEDVLRHTIRGLCLAELVPSAESQQTVKTTDPYPFRPCITALIALLGQRKVPL